MYSMCVFQVLHSMVSNVERPPTTPAGSQLVLRCKDFRVFQILIPQERDCLDVHTSLVRLSRPGACVEVGKCESLSDVMYFVGQGVMNTC